MPRPMGHIRILFSSRVLLDLEEADRVFKDKGPEAYTDFLRCRGEYRPDYDPSVQGRLLKKGPLFDMAMALHRLNALSKDPIVEIGMSCKDEVSSAIPIFRNLDVAGLGVPIEYRVATAGKPLSKCYHEAFGTDLLLTRSAEDAQTAVDMGVAAAVINFPPEGTYDYDQDMPCVRIIVDGDAVAFGSSAEVRYRREGLEVYREMEGKEFNKPVEPGPFTAILAKISQLNERFPKDNRPFELSLLTARGSLAGARALATAEEHGIKFNGGMAFMGGSSKHEFLKAHKPHLFLDDQTVHLIESSKYCPTGLVTYAAGSPMHVLQQELKAAEEKKRESAATPAAAAFQSAANSNTPQDCGGKACDKTDCKPVHVARKRAAGNEPK